MNYFYNVNCLIICSQLAPKLGLATINFHPALRSLNTVHLPSSLAVVYRHCCFFYWDHWIDTTPSYSQLLESVHHHSAHITSFPVQAVVISAPIQFLVFPRCCDQWADAVLPLPVIGMSAQRTPSCSRLLGPPTTIIPAN